MPFDRSKYPPDWREIAASVRARAGDKCEGTPHFPDCRAVNGKPHPVTGSRVVLTVAHLDHDTTHNDPENLRALCQRCHLDWDLDYHMANARHTRWLKKLGGQTAKLPLLYEDGSET